MPRSAKENDGRLNIYVSRQLWRRVKLAAAERDVSVSEFCAEAIEARLAGDASAASAAPKRSNAVAHARKFKKTHFGKSTLRVSTAELLRASREGESER